MWSTNLPVEKLMNSAPVTMRIAAVTYAGAPRKRDPVSQSRMLFTVTFARSRCPGSRSLRSRSLRSRSLRSRSLPVLPEEPLHLVGEVVGRGQVLLLRDGGRVTEDHALVLGVLGVDAGFET